MEDLSLHINQLNAKLQQLLKQHAALLAENEQHKKKIAAFKATGQQQNEQLAELHQQQLLMKASLDTLDSKEKKELEQKINGYIRNIDKCISLLSYNQNP